MTADPPAVLDRSGYLLEVEDTFDGPTLDERLWLPYYLPQWSSRAVSAARYDIGGGGGGLRLRIDADQAAWSAEYTGELRVSSLQTGVFAGPVGSEVGQHRFRDGLVVREAQEPVRLYTPQYGLFELRARFPDDPAALGAMWMIGYEDEPERSAEICIVEIFGRNVRPDGAGIGMGVHPFHDPAIRDDFTVEEVAIEVREPHTYAAAWTPEAVAFYVDDQLVRVVRQSPAYPMQFMLNVYEFRDATGPAGSYPKEFAVDWFRGWRPADTPPRWPMTR